MADVRLLDVDITDRANGKLPVWDSSAGTHVYEDPSTSGVPAGTSNPGSPSDGDLFYRTDLDLLIRYRSSGTRWVTATLYIQPLDTQRALNNLTATNTFDSPRYNDLGLWIEKFMVTMYVVTTNDGTRYWTAAAEGVTLSTQNLAANTTHHLQGNVNAVRAVDSGPFGMALTKVSTPGGLIVTGLLTYRLIVT